MSPVPAEVQHPVVIFETVSRKPVVHEGHRDGLGRRLISDGNDVLLLAAGVLADHTIGPLRLEGNQQPGGCGPVRHILIQDRVIDGIGRGGFAVDIADAGDVSCDGRLTVRPEVELLHQHLPVRYYDLLVLPTLKVVGNPHQARVVS